MNLSTLTAQIKATTSDWAVEGKGGAESFEHREKRRRKREKETREREDRGRRSGRKMKAHGQEELQVGKYFIAGE